MIRYAMAVLVPLPTLALAQDFKGYRTTSIDAVIDDWNGRTKSEGPGFSISRPEKIKFIATLRAAPVSCDSGPLPAVLRILGFAHILNQVKVNHCVTLGSKGGRAVVAFVQDVLVPGLNIDAKVGHPVEIYADFLAYEVGANWSQNTPILLVNRFEPQ